MRNAFRNPCGMGLDSFLLYLFITVLLKGIADTVSMALFLILLNNTLTNPSSS